MPRRTRIALVGKVEAWETEAREEDLNDLRSVLQREWSQHLADLAMGGAPLDESRQPASHALTVIGAATTG
jgi:hypothetical protein